ncbi:hypothetical protein [Isachenkonia alkalipeptolytica]|uniref:Uncharacterized protein n=1 Tax=Isachenkonia alkalipeptolytica TaxID=2565777 RepID=A0AA44BDB2_9CLOT|nr:hypothetical protein [Isachenkonia alkalipeptolytica]NBG87762.1 hypothetical protein [Isachenkonia alkalipeptolytica]
MTKGTKEVWTLKKVGLLILILLLAASVTACRETDEEPAEEVIEEKREEDENSEEETEELEEDRENFEEIKTALKEEQWSVAGELISKLSGEGKNAVFKWDEEYSNIGSRDRVIEALSKGVVVTEEMAKEYMDGVMKNRFEPLDEEVLQGSKEGLLEWFQSMESWRMDEVILFHNNFLNITDEIKPDRLETVVLTEEALMEAEPFEEYVHRWFYGHSDNDGSDLWRGVTPLQITDVDLASAMGATFGPLHPAIELLAEENDLVDTELKDDSLVLVIENIQEGYSLSPGTYELTYEIEEVEEKKFGVRGYEVNEISN